VVARTKGWRPRGSAGAAAAWGLARQGEWMLVQRVLVVDDHPMYRTGLRRMFDESERFRVVAEAENGHQAIHLTDIHRPDIIVLDVQLPGVSGLKVARILRKLNPRGHIVFLSMHLDDGRLFEAIRSGAVAFLTKDVEPDAMLASLHRIADGENLINHLVFGRSSLASRVLNEFRGLATEPVATAPLEPLSTREVEVLDCVAQGLSNKEIARELYVTEQTIKNHITSVLRKLDVNDRVQAVLYGVRNGWIEIGPRPYAATVGG